MLLGENSPDPPDQVPPVAIDTNPSNSTSASLAHDSRSSPASTTGAGVNVTSMLSLTATQSSLPVVVSVRVTDPLDISVAVGVYTAVKLFADGKKDPLPPDQVAPVAIVIAPSSCTCALFAQRI